MPNEREQLISGLFEAWNERGTEGFLAYLTERDAVDPGFTMEIQRDAPNAGVWHGPDGFREMARNWMDAWQEFEIYPEEQIEVEPGRMIVPARQRAVARGSGMGVDSLYVYAFEFDGRRVRRVGLFFDRPEAERFLSSSPPEGR